MNRKGIVWGLVLTLLFLAPANMAAQETDAARPQIFICLTQNDEQSGQVEINQPSQIENLLKMQIANNHLQKGIPGYRIRIFSQSGQTARQKAEETRLNFMKNFPEQEALLAYNAPNFQIFVGNFRTRNEALREMKQIEKTFPGAFIVSEIIHLPKPR